MAILTARQAKTRFGERLDRVASGEEIVITRHGKPVARLIPEDRRSLMEVRQAVSDLHRLRRDMAARHGFTALTDREIREARDDGRPSVM